MGGIRRQTSKLIEELNISKETITVKIKKYKLEKPPYLPDNKVTPSRIGP
jgi:hypothetical protein